MTADEEQKPIDRVFAELKAKGLVAAKRKLVCKKPDWWCDFAADRTRPVIYYNERHSSLPEDPLRFALLHEEYHTFNKKNWTRLSAFYSVCFVIVALAILRSLGILGVILIPVVLIALWPASSWVFKTAIRADETKADLHAAKTLIEEFEIEEPSVVATSIFKTIRARPRNRRSLTYWVMRFLTAGLHPTDDERIKAIQKYEESLVKEAVKRMEFS